MVAQAEVVKDAQGRIQVWGCAAQMLIEFADGTRHAVLRGSIVLATSQVGRRLIARRLRPVHPCAQRAQEMRAGGVSGREIARQLRVSQMTVLRWLALGKAAA